MGRRLRWGLVGLAVALAAVAVAMYPEGRPIGPAGCARIWPGMTRQQVWAAIGLSPGRYDDGPEWCLPRVDVVREWGSAADRHADGDEWVDDPYILDVYYDADGRVDGCTLVRVVQGNPLDGFVWRLKRQWQRWFS